MGGTSTTTAPVAPPRGGGRIGDARAFSAVARMLLAAGLLFTVLISGSDSGRLVTPIRAAGALVGAAVIIYYLRTAPRRHDRVDQLVLGGLLLFLATCAVSSAPRLSFEAATTALAYAAAFYIARDVAVTDAGRSLTIAVLGLLGTTVAITVLIPWSIVWAQWLSVPGAGAPRFDLVLPSTQYYPVSAAMLVGLTLPATVLLATRPLVWPIAAVGTAASLAVIFMSGSRTLWIGLVAAGVAVGLSDAGWARPIRRRAVIGAAMVAVAVAAATMPQLVARMFASSSVDIRLAIWGDSIRLWVDSPLFGHGPGTYASAFALSGFYNSYATYIDHAHSLPVQLLVEGGLVGTLGGVLLVAAVAAGMRRGQLASSAALGALVLFAVLSLTADPAVDAFFVAPLIVWAAMLAPRTAITTSVSPSSWVRLATAAGALVVVTATVATLAAAWSRDQIPDGRDGHGVAADRLRAATTLDPANALYRRELGALLMVIGDPAGAVQELEDAVRLNRGDLAALRGLALARLATGDDAGALAAAKRAVGLAGGQPANALTIAYVAQATGDQQAAGAGLVRAVRAAPWIAAAQEWSAVFPGTSPEDVLEGAWETWRDASDVSYRNARARAWLAGIADTVAPSDVSRDAEAESALLRCKPDVAAAVLAQLSSPEATAQASLQAQLMLERVAGDAADPRLSTLIALHDRNLWRLAYEGVSGGSPMVDYFADVTVYSMAPIDAGGALLFPTEASGLSAWLRDPIDAADTGAPNSPLSMCR